MDILYASKYAGSIPAIPILTVHEESGGIPTGTIAISTVLTKSLLTGWLFILGGDQYQQAKEASI